MILLWHRRCCGIILGSSDQASTFRKSPPFPFFINMPKVCRYAVPAAAADSDTESTDVDLLVHGRAMKQTKKAAAPARKTKAMKSMKAMKGQKAAAPARKTKGMKAMKGQKAAAPAPEMKPMKAMKENIQTYIHT